VREKAVQAGKKGGDFPKILSEKTPETSGYSIIIIS
jgi:hypothetical protein